MTGSKQDYINYRIDKSNEIYEDALLLANNQRWNSCVNRLYYCSYYLASALLYQSDIKAETHNGVKTQLFLNFVKSNLLDKELGKLYAHLFDWRQESDYADFIDFDEETVIPLLDEVKILNSKLLELINQAPNNR
ncbi:HEPN domain-containing protein [Carboxylicivirga marina]|uniref:HEPN domain-containing protein n=1 Tax=Carboxylicivirga marina TaxID=2800988 RepID=A0ABS1HQR0_9BACT|nr:HEPN domain-containing protein [Carboxylicivirga marina]MBK3519926.1 HEPN domain-containing protein [Carboxylicivirga marina]